MTEQLEVTEQRDRLSRIPFFLVDLVLVVVFAVLGRMSHKEPLEIFATLGTAAPFVGALLLSWLILLLTKIRHDRIWPAGVLVWVVTVSSGLALRVLFGSTAAFPFVVVTTVVLAVFLLGSRAVWQLVRRRATPTANDSEEAAGI